ncbi:MAG: alpha/beta fold hydrolase, partial [Solirubrobacterales bacterium]
MGQIRERRLELGGFRTRALELAGDADRPPLILLHGWGDSADCWRPLLPELERLGRHVIAFDMPGFGEAARLDRERPVLTQLDRFTAAAVRELAESAGREVVVCGNSLGGCASLRAAQRPELPIAGIVPVAPAGLDMAQWFGIIESAPIVRALLRAPVPLPETVVREAVGRAYRQLAFTRPSAVEKTAVTSFTRHLSSRRDIVRVLATGRRLRPELGEDCFRLERIHCPVLVVWGDADKMVYSSGAERILREIEGSRLEVIPSCGHCPQVEAAEKLALLLDDFPAATADAVADAEAAYAPRAEPAGPKRSSS